MTLRLAVDLDGVVADFEARQYELCAAAGIPLVPYAERTQPYCHDEPGHEEYRDAIRDIVATPGFFRGFDPIPGSIDALHALVDAGVVVMLCSTPLLWPSHSVTEKLGWVEEHLGPDWVDRLVMTRDKSLAWADLLIDDWPTVRNEGRARWRRVVFDQPYNRSIDPDIPRLLFWPPPDETPLFVDQLELWAGGGIRRIDIREFQERGFLHETNRLALHPVSLALEVWRDDDGEMWLGGIWDYRDDPEGIAMGKVDDAGLLVENGVDNAKAAAVYNEYVRHLDARQTIMSLEPSPFMVQARPRPPEPNPFVADVAP